MFSEILFFGQKNSPGIADFLLPVLNFRLLPFLFSGYKSEKTGFTGLFGGVLSIVGRRLFSSKKTPSSPR
jgi:hypothetical protein